MTFTFHATLTGPAGVTESPLRVGDGYSFQASNIVDAWKLIDAAALASSLPAIVKLVALRLEVVND